MLLMGGYPLGVERIPIALVIIAAADVLLAVNLVFFRLALVVVLDLEFLLDVLRETRLRLHFLLRLEHPQFRELLLEEFLLLISEILERL